MKELLVARSQLQGEAGEGGVLWRVDDAFAQVMGAKRGGRVWGVGFGPTSSGTYMRIWKIVCHYRHPLQ